MNPRAEIMPLVRRYCYGSSGTPPLGYSERRDAQIAGLLVKRYGLADVCLAIKGLKSRRPITLRFFVETEKYPGAAAERFLEALSAGRKVEEQEAESTRAQIRFNAMLEAE